MEFSREWNRTEELTIVLWTLYDTEPLEWYIWSMRGVLLVPRWWVGQRGHRGYTRIGGVGFRNGWDWVKR